MKTRRVYFTTLLSVFLANASLAQLSFNTFSANIGAIRTTFPDDSRYSKYQYAIYPEFQVGGDFVVSYFRWTIYWGFWNDGITQALPVADMVTYSNQSHITGFRFTFLPSQIAPEWPLPVGVFGGIAHHFMSATYVGGLGLDGKPGQDFTQGSSTFELGLNAHLSILGPIKIGGEVHQYFPLSDEYLDRTQKNRRAYKVGLTIEL